MLAVRERLAAPFLAKAARPISADAAEIFSNVAFIAQPGAPLPRPQRYDDLARKYGAVVWVYAAVHRKATDVASVPLKIVTRQLDGTLTEVTMDHPMRDVLSRVNPFTTAGDLIESTSANLDLSGNAYWLKFADRKGVIRELWALRPDLVQIIPSSTDYIAGYLVQAGRREFTFAPEQIIHFREFNPFSDYYGLGALTACYSSATIEEEAQQWNRAMMRNAGRLDGMLISDQAVSVAQARQAASEFRDQFAGARNAHRVMVLGKGMKYTTVATTPKELDFVLSRKLTREEILGALGVRPVMLGLEAGDIGRRSEQIRDYFYATVGARIGRIVATLNEFLAPDFNERGLEVIAEVETALMPYEDRFALAQADGAYVEKGILRRNEVRRRLGYASVPGGDEILVLNTMVPLAVAVAPPLEGVPPPGPAIVSTRPPERKDGDPRGALWDAFVAKATPHERAMKAAVYRALVATGQHMKGLVEGGHHPATVVTEGLAVGKRLLEQAARDQLPTAMEAGFMQAAARVNEQLAQRALRKDATATIGIDWSLEIPELARYLQDRPVQYADLVVAALSPDFRALLADQANQGASIADMATAVADHMDAIAPAKATAIARTEVIAAANLAATVAYAQSGVVANQSWLSARDERVRVDHAIADGQIQPLGQPFEIGGAQLMYPGDPSGPAEQVCNCRCTILPELEEA